MSKYDCEGAATKEAQCVKAKMADPKLRIYDRIPAVTDNKESE